MKLPETVRNLFEGKNLAFLATLNRDGSAQVTPVWSDTDGEHVLINTAVGRLKERHTKRDPRVTVSVADQADPYLFTTIRGRVVERITGEAAAHHIDRLATKYLGVEKYPYLQPGEQRILLKVEPERILLPRQ